MTFFTVGIPQSVSVEIDLKNDGVESTYFKVSFDIKFVLISFLIHKRSTKMSTKMSTITEKKQEKCEAKHTFNVLYLLLDLHCLYF